MIYPISIRSIFYIIQNDVTKIMDDHYQAELMDGSGECGPMIWKDFEWIVALETYRTCILYNVDVKETLCLLAKWEDKWRKHNKYHEFPWIDVVMALSEISRFSEKELLKNI